MRSTPGVLAVAALFGIGGCSDGSSEPRTEDSSGRVLKVAVSRSGAIRLDGVPVTLEELRRELAAVAGTDAEVWYYREDGQGEPPKEAMSVIQAIVEHELPVSLSSTPDYSTVVMPDGSVRPRR